MGLFYQVIPKNLTILYARVSRSHDCEIDQNPGLTGICICFGCHQQNWESWKGFKLFILMIVLMTVYERIGFVVCIFWHICHRYFIHHQAIYYFIERFDYFLVCSVINVFVMWRSEQEYEWSQTIASVFFMAQGLLPVKLTHSTYTQSHTHTHTHL